jgi:hypothetical protein
MYNWQRLQNTRSRLHFTWKSEAASIYQKGLGMLGDLPVLLYALLRRINLGQLYLLWQEFWSNARAGESTAFCAQGYGILTWHLKRREFTNLSPFLVCFILRGDALWLHCKSSCILPSFTVSKKDRIVFGVSQWWNQECLRATGSELCIKFSIIWSIVPLLYLTSIIGYFSQLFKRAYGR